MADEWVRTVRAYWPEKIVPGKPAADPSKTAS